MIQPRSCSQTERSQTECGYSPGERAGGTISPASVKPGPRLGRQPLPQAAPVAGATAGLRSGTVRRLENARRCQDVHGRRATCPAASVTCYPPGAIYTSGLGGHQPRPGTTVVIAILTSMVTVVLPLLRPPRHLRIRRAERFGPELVPICILGPPLSYSAIHPQYGPGPLPAMSETNRNDEWMTWTGQGRRFLAQASSQNGGPSAC